MSKKRTRVISSRALVRLQRRQAAAAPAFTIKVAWPSVIVECACAARTLLVLIGDASPVTCPACGAKRKIEANWTMNVGPV